MFTRLYKSIFREKIDDISAKLHINDPEWFDINWDELVIWFNNNNDFQNFIEFYLLNEPNVLILNVLLKHDFDFKTTNFYHKIRLNGKEENISLEVFKWIIDNKIIKKDDNNFSDFCKGLLREADQLSFDKFKYAFEEGFPVSTEYSITISNINIAEQIWQYANNSRNIKFRYNIPLLVRKLTLEFLREYIEWLKLHGTEDKVLGSLWEQVARKFGINGLQLFKENGYLLPRPHNFKDFTPEIKNYLLSNGFWEVNELSDGEIVYHTQPIINQINDVNSVATEKII